MTAGGDQISLRQRRQFVLFGVDGAVRGDTPPTFFSVRSSHDSCPLQTGISFVGAPRTRRRKTRHAGRARAPVVIVGSATS